MQKDPKGIVKVWDAEEEKDMIYLLEDDDSIRELVCYSLTKTGSAFFDRILQEQKIKSLRRVYVLTIDGTGKIYLQLKGEKYRSFRVQLPEGSAW